MGFIPILITSSAAILLFIMVVNLHLKTKKNQILRLQEEIVNGLERYDVNTISKETSGGIENLDNHYHQVKKRVEIQKLSEFENEIRAPYLKLKIQIAQFNKLIKTKPYNMVANLLGYRPI